MGLMGLYVIAAIGAAVCCIGVLPGIGALAKSSGMLDLPDHRAKQSMPGPRFGGLAVGAPLIVFSIIAMLMAARFGSPVNEAWGRMITL